MFKGLRRLKKILKPLKPLQQSVGDPAFGWQVQPLQLPSFNYLCGFKQKENVTTAPFRARDHQKRQAYSAAEPGD